MTTNKPSILPAEWQYRSAVLLSWPHAGTDWAYMLDDVVDTYVYVVKYLSAKAHLLIVAPNVREIRSMIEGYACRGSVTFAEMPTDDTWARDFGMICTQKADGTWAMNDFMFNGWGLKFRACHDNLITGTLYHRDMMFYRHKADYVNRLGFVLEGGSIESDGAGTLMTTTECLMSPNRNGQLSSDEIEDRLKEYFGCKKVIWLNHGYLRGDDTDSHIDTLARFLPGNIIAYSSCDREDDEHYGELRSMEDELKCATNADGMPYRLVPLPIPEPIYDEDGERLPATYANFLIVNGTLFLPMYGDEKYDLIALKRLREALPDYEVVAIPECQQLIRQHGSLHCITMQFPEETLIMHNLMHNA